MVLGGRLPVELDSFGRIFAGAPAEFVAESRAVPGFCVAVFGGSDEEGKGAVVVFLTFPEEARGVTVSEVVLSKGVAAVGEALEDVAGFAEELGGRAGGA